MVCMWFIHGEYMIYTYIYGLHVVNIWSVYDLYGFPKVGIYMGKVWENYGKSMGHIFMDNQYETLIYALYMGNTPFGNLMIEHLITCTKL